MKAITRLTAVIAITLCAAGCVKAAAPIALEKGGMHLKAQANGTVTISDATGKDRLKITGYDLAWAPYKTDGGTPAIVNLADGSQAIKIDYRVKAKGRQEQNTIRISGTFSLQNEDAMCKWRCGGQMISMWAERC